MSKREKNKAENRLRLIGSAAKAFAAYGVKGANINLISLDAGLGKGTVYNYFPSKDELYLAVLARAGQELAPRVEEAAVAAGSTPDRLRPLITALFAYYRDDPDRAKLLLRAVADHRVENQRAIAAAFQPLLDRFQAALEYGRDSGELRDELDPFISAVTLWGMINHQAAFHWLVSTRPLDPEALADLVMTYFMNGITRR